jgi:sulfate transport system permease protein
MLPLAAVALRSLDGGMAGFWQAVTAPRALASLQLTLECALGVVAINAAIGTLIAWVLVRDRFPGRALVDALIDLPLALPTIVAGLTLLSLYGPRGPVWVNVAYTRASVVLALLFVTLPFVVRSVQPVLVDIHSELEHAAATLGAPPWKIFQRIILPGLVPATVTGMALGFARCMGEFGAVVLLSGNVPFSTEVSSVYIYGLVDSNDVSDAAAVSMALLLVSLVVLLALFVGSRWLRHHGH